MIEFSPTSPCPVCQSRLTSDLCTASGYRVRRCPTCATDFVADAPDASALRAYYDRREWFESGETGGYQNYDAQTETLLPFFDSVLDEFKAAGTGLSLLDVGCGYGTHLARAHQRGWKCFGVELSAHAREVIGQRLAPDIFIADTIENLIPHAFDLIVMFDVLEHVADPYALLYGLFARGAITERTQLVITTPNARCRTAVAQPAQWPYRHPPSHLTYFSAHSLTLLLQRLQFTQIDVQGQHADSATPDSTAAYPDEQFPANDRLIDCAGLYCSASGSRFAHFMQERYVPGTWSKLAEYEHLPRYRMASELVAGKRVLDFGCGTGYGSALLAAKAASVTALDIDASALEWAKERHHRDNLLFVQSDQLGAELPDGSFDVIVCFEMIEHVSEETQHQTIGQLTRLLAPNGQLLISTPNPEITSLYGVNPFHLREMNRQEFESLLRKHFPQVQFLEQTIQPAVLVAPEGSCANGRFRQLSWSSDGPAGSATPAVFVAICADQAVHLPPATCYLDSATDLVHAHMEAAQRITQAQLAQVRAAESAVQATALADGYKAEAAVLQQRLSDFQKSLSTANQQLHERNVRSMELEAALHERNLQVQERDARLISMHAALERAWAELHRYRWVRKLDNLFFRRRP